jgi:dipeptidyl-peptidase-3
MFKCLLAAGGDFLTVTHDKSSDKLTVSIDQTKISTHGKPAIADLMLKLHIWRCTADAKECREYYVPLTEPTGVYLEWRRITEFQSQCTPKVNARSKTPPHHKTR